MNPLPDLARVVVHKSNRVVVSRQVEPHLADDGFTGITRPVDQNLAPARPRDQIAVNPGDESDTTCERGQQKGVNQQD